MRCFALVFALLTALSAPSASAAGSLSGSSAAVTASQTVNLTTQGTADWAHWGLTTATSFDHKNSGGTTPVALISNYTALGTGTVARYTDNLVGFTWTGGTPTANATASTAGVYIKNTGSGFQFTVPADTATRTLTLYVGGAGSEAALTAHLSDGSAADFTDASYGYDKPGNISGNNYYAVYTLTYQAASAGQTLSVSWVQTASANGGNVTLQAAALTITPPSVPTSLTATGGTGLIGLTWTASTSATSYSLYRGTTAGGEGTTAYKTGLTGTSYTDTGVTAGTAYYYTLKAVNPGYTSAASNEAHATPSAAVSLVGLSLGSYGIVAGTSGSGLASFSGTSSTPVVVSCASDNMSISVPSSLTLPANQSSLTFTYTANDVFVPTTATVSVSYNGKTQTSQITVQPAIQLSVAPTGNDATGKGKISLFWTGVTTATGYNIYRQSTGGGAFIRIASNVKSKDTGPVLMDTYVFTDTGLTNGTSYAYYVVAVMPSGTEKGTSNIDADTPDPTSIPWDTQNAANIVAAAQAEAASALIPDPEDPDQTPEPVGTLMVASPDGIVYVGNLPDGTPAQAFPASGYYDATSNQIIYSDGTAGGVSPDAVDTSTSNQSLLSNGVAPNASVGETQLPALPPTGITRQIQSQPGFAGMAATIGLPNASDPTQVRLAYNGSGFDQQGKPHNYNSVGDIYTGGHVVFPASVIADPKNKGLGLGNALGNIDAGLQLTEYPVANTAWQPIAAGTAHQSILLGGAGGKPISNLYKVFVTGQVLFEFQTPLISRVKSKHILMHYTKPYTADSNLYGNFSLILRRQNGTKDANGNPNYDKTLNETSVTLFYTGGSAEQWLKTTYDPNHPERGNNQFVIKRTNSIAQTINPIGYPGAPPVYTNAPTANGPGNGFYMDGSYLLGGAWGVNDTQGVVLLHTGTGYESWTDSSTVTSLAGSYPLDTRYIKWNPSNPYYYEPNLNMRTSLGTLPGF